MWKGKKSLSKPHAAHNIPESSGVTNPDQSNPKTNSAVEPTKSKRKSMRLVNQIGGLQKHVDRMEIQTQNVHKENQEQKEQLEAIKGNVNTYQTKS